MIQKAVNKWIFVGLGNPGEEYERTRHNVGRMTLEAFRQASKFASWEYDKKINALVSAGKIGKAEVVLILPETFMNKSGNSVKSLVTSAERAHRLAVVYDDLDLPFGSLKLSFNRGSGGHRGIESIIRQIKTKEFARLRVGVTPTSPTGKLKKPNTEDKVHDFILGKFKPAEDKTLKKSIKRAVEILNSVAEDGYLAAMNKFN